MLETEEPEPTEPKEEDKPLIDPKVWAKYNQYCLEHGNINFWEWLQEHYDGKH